MKLTSSQIKKYNKIADAGKNPIMVRVGHNWYTWYEGDPKHGVFLTTQSGADVEFDFKQIDDIQESKMIKMKSKLREMIREELNEGKNFTKSNKLAKRLESRFSKLSATESKIIDIIKKMREDYQNIYGEMAEEAFELADKVDELEGK